MSKINTTREIRLHITRRFGDIEHVRQDCFMCVAYDMGVDDALADN